MAARRDRKQCRFSWRGLAVNLALALASVVVFALVLEFVVFRFILVPSDIPRNAYLEDVIRLAPNQHGWMRARGRPVIEFRINDRGWNSGHPHYAFERTPGRQRIAVLGDSYVAGMHVDYDQTVAEKLERKLGPETHEVYRFALAASPLSQYLHVFRHEALRFHPDLAVFVVVHNDFDQSYNLELGRYATSFLRLAIRPDGTVEEIQPEPYVAPWYTWIRGSASYRYLVDTWGLDIQGIKDLVNFWRVKKVYQANIDVSKLKDRMAHDELATDYVFGQLRQAADAHGVALLLVMDGDRGSLYQGQDPETLYRTGALRLNRMAARMAAKHAIPFIDLHPRFAEDYRQNRQIFDFPNDRHWNERGHEIAAQAIADYLAANQP